MTVLAPPVRARRWLFYGWYIAMAGAATNFLIGGIVNFGFGVFIDPIREELGWSLTLITIGFSLRSFQSGLLAPVTGMIVDRVGPRRMSLLGVVVVAGGLLLLANAHSLPVFYAASLLMAIGQSMGGFTSFSAAIVKWFNRKRARAMGMITAGNGFGYLFAPPLALLVDGLGWRGTLVVCACLVLLVGIPLALIVRDKPETYGDTPDGELLDRLDEAEDVGGVAPIASTYGYTVAEAVRMPAFYLLVLAMTFSVPTQNAFITFQIPHLDNAGYSLTGAAFLAAGYGMIQGPLRFIGGWAADRVGRKRMYILSFLLQGVGLVIFSSLDPTRPWLIPLFYAVYATGHALFAALFMTITADYFGTYRFASIQGLIMTALMPLGIALPILTGVVFDLTDTYRYIFLVYAGLTSMGALWVSLVRRPTWAEAAAERPAAVLD